MPSPSAKNLERLVQEMQAGEHPRSPLNMQMTFDEAARQDLSNVIGAEFQAGEGLDRDFWVVHYTDVSTVLSMLKRADNSYLRMYSTTGSNDPDEGTYVEKELSDHDERKLQLGAHQFAYVASFIQPNRQEDRKRAADNLTFWRTYGREGAGCSLTVQLPGRELLAVKYGKTETRNSIGRLQSAIGNLLETAETVAREVGASAQPFEQMLYLVMEKVRYLYKSAAYAYERECRLVETPATIKDKGIEPCFDYSGPADQKRVKRYIDYPRLATKQLLISGSAIRLGPTVPHREETKAYIEYLLRNANLFGPKVRCSPIRYRRSTNYQ